jgi:hypothetical protein
LPFGLRTRRKKEENIREKPEIIYPMEYLGGHKLFPNDKTRAAVGLFTDRIEILGGPLHLVIPYSDITGVESYQQGVKINKAAILQPVTETWPPTSWDCSRDITGDPK